MDTTIEMIDNFIDSNNRGWKDLDNIILYAHRGKQQTIYYYKNEPYIAKAQLIETDNGLHVCIMINVDKFTFDQINQEIFTRNVKSIYKPVHFDPDKYKLSILFSNKYMILTECHSKERKFLFKFKTGIPHYEGDSDDAYEIS